MKVELKRQKAENNSLFEMPSVEKLEGRKKSTEKSTGSTWKSSKPSKVIRGNKQIGSGRTPKKQTVIVVEDDTLTLGLHIDKLSLEIESGLAILSEELDHASMQANTTAVVVIARIIKVIKKVRSLS